MKIWIEKVYQLWIGGLGKRGSLLVYNAFDAFEAHMTDPVKATFKQENTDLAFISGG